MMNSDVIPLFFFSWPKIGDPLLRKMSSFPVEVTQFPMQQDLLLHRDGVRYPLAFSRKGNSRDRIRTKCSIVIFLALIVQDPPIVYEKGTLKQKKSSPPESCARR
ncbi:Hydroxynaphthalene reductase arp2 [Fusarium oxysporum f. sp. albedinis]|nr:Hydroxynaphthalene reductase arp2 [Fusarium oxysporum f. sp. albedinis]